MSSTDHTKELRVNLEKVAHQAGSNAILAYLEHEVREAEKDTDRMDAVVAVILGGLFRNRRT